MRKRRARRWACLLLLLAGLPAAAGPEPLPDPAAFLDKVRETLLSDQLLLSRYTYDEAYVTRKLNRKGRTKETETGVYEVFPSLDPELNYRRLVFRDGSPVPEEQLAKADRKHAEKVRKHLERLDREEVRQRIAKRKLEREEEDREIVDEAFRAFRFEMQGREEINGRAAIVFRIEPREDYRPSKKAVRRMKNMNGTMWVSEADHEMIRLELELIDNMTVGGGLVAKLKKGAHVEFQRRKINDEIWLPVESRARGSARLFLVKRLAFDDARTYSKHQKYTADSSWTNAPPAAE